MALAGGLAGCGGDPVTAPPPDDTPLPEFSLPSTAFLSESATLAPGDVITRSFTNAYTSVYLFRFVSQYAADAAIFNPKDIEAFTRGDDIPTVAAVQLAVGTISAVLPAGRYVVGVRSRRLLAQNNVQYALDRLTWLPAERGHAFVYRDTYRYDTRFLSPGEAYVRPITIEARMRYLIDGAAIGTSLSVIAVSDTGVFRRGEAVATYASVTDQAELKLPPGEYALAYRNPSVGIGVFTYTLDRWRVE